jgi:hypothetical protein
MTPNGPSSIDDAFANPFDHRDLARPETFLKGSQMSVRIRKSLQGLALALPLAVVTGQLPAMAAPAAPVNQSRTADAPPVSNPPAPATAPAATSTPAVAGAPKVEPASVPNLPGQSTGTTEPGVSALDIKEDVAEICAGAPILPIKIGGATTLKELLQELNLFDVLTKACVAEGELAASIEKFTGPGGALDLAALLKVLGAAAPAQVSPQA